MTLQERLQNSIQGAVRFDRTSRAIYSTDASIYEIIPHGAILPSCPEDIETAVHLAWEEGVTVTARGAGTSIAGNAIGAGLIIDSSKHLNRILNIDIKNERVTVQPGVIQEQLNTALAPHGYMFGPDTSTSNRATIGGMIGNNSSGAHSLRHGRTVDHVESVRLVLDDGTVVRLGPLTETELAAKCALKNREGDLYRKISALRTNYGDVIRSDFPKHPRRSSGYNLDELVKPNSPLNLAKLVVGAEGSLGVITEATLRIVPKPGALGICILSFADMIDALAQSEAILAHDPCAVEVIDRNIIEMGRMSPSMRGRLDWLTGDPAALVIVEFDGANNEAVQQKLDSFFRAVNGHMGYAASCTTDTTTMANVWALRKSGLGLLLARRSYSRGIAFVEDMSVPPGQLAPAIREFTDILTKHGKTAGIYGHSGPGCLHMRPFMNMRDKSELRLMESLMQELLRIVKKHNGVLSGEHGDGHLRSWQNPELFGPQLFAAFRELKAAFDPQNRMNPGVIIPTHGFNDHLRMDDSVRPLEVATAFDWSKEGGFGLSVDMCNGNGHCRKREGIMCPSFQVTGDEFDSTRARAQTLRQIINGRADPAALTGEGLHEVLDLCLECKGCKKECPSQVDMAKMKAEVLYHYHKQHGVSLRTRLFGYLPTLNRIGCATAPLSNWFATRWPVKDILGWLGIATERTLPPFATQRFSSWWKQNYRSAGRPVVLMNDTYTEFNEPTLGKDASYILQKLGYQVIVPPYHCCGRPLISKGLLDEAKNRAAALIKTLLPYAEAGHKIVGLEPSCILTLRDEFPSLLPGKDADTLAAAAITLDEFLAQEVDEGRLQPHLHNRVASLSLHGHCHQKSLVGTGPTLKVLRALPGGRVDEIPSGCCGMAGSFGYEKEHYAFSMAVGETHLFPAIRKISESTLLVASGISCRGQIKHGVKREAHHLTAIVRKWMTP